MSLGMGRSGRSQQSAGLRLEATVKGQSLLRRRREVLCGGLLSRRGMLGRLSLRPRWSDNIEALPL